MPAATPDAESVSAALLAWIAAGRRDLPWRRRRNPYTVLVSEVMLQQTQVATVIPYFERWLARFPDLATLAVAPLDEVLKAWEGLGYYARARHLHAIARRVAEVYGGRLPAERGELLRLPGVGRYTAGAILSLAYGQAEPVLDGNVRRVLCRLYDIAEDPRAPAVEARLWALAGALVQAVPPGRAGDLNEALMELGALVCTPGAPDCPACPVSSHCLAYRRGTQAARPARTPRQATPQFDAVAAVIAGAGGRYLIAQRPARGLLGGLWEFPGERTGLPAGERATPAQLAGVLAAALERKLGVVAVPAAGGPFLRVPHAYTHFRITLHVFHVALAGSEPQPLGYVAVHWTTAAGLAAYALPATDQKIAAALTRL